MARKLPPLNSLPCLEAAARLLNFSKAADELHVTPGAISRATKHLEDRLNVLLFERKTRSVRLTTVGESYARAVRDALERIRCASPRISSTTR